MICGEVKFSAILEDQIALLRDELRQKGLGLKLRIEQSPPLPPVGAQLTTFNPKFFMMAGALFDPYASDRTDLNDSPPRYDVTIGWEGEEDASALGFLLLGLPTVFALREKA